MAAQTNQPSMSDLVGQMSAFFAPASDRYANEVKAAQAIKSIDPSILQQAVSQGGPLSTAEDFASSNAWTMTPDMFKQTIQGRPDAMKTAGELTALSDAIFGRSAERKALEGAAKNRFDASADAVNSAGKMYEGAMGRQSQEKIAREHNQNQMDITKMNRASAEKIAFAQMQNARDLARVASSGGFGGYYADLAKKGQPLHTEQEQAQIARVIQSDPKKLDPSVLAQAKLRAIQLGLIGTSGEPVKISRGGWFKGDDTYQVRVNKQTGQRHVIKLLDGGKLEDMGLISTMVPSRAMGGANSGSTSVPAYMTQGYGE